MEPGAAPHTQRGRLAQFAPARERARKRTSGGQLLAQARAALRGLPFFGLTEHLDASMCLLFDALS